MYWSKCKILQLAGLRKQFRIMDITKSDMYNIIRPSTKFGTNMKISMK